MGAIQSGEPCFYKRWFARLALTLTLSQRERGCCSLSLWERAGVRAQAQRKREANSMRL